MSEDLPVLNPGKTRLIVVDVQNDFCHEGGAFGKMGIPMGPIQEAVSRLAGFLEGVRRAGMPAIFVRTEHSEWTNAPSWLTRRVTAGAERVLPCAQGTWGAEFYRLQPAPGDRVVVKHRYSAFAGTELDLLLRSRGVTHLLLAGVATNVCVESTARDGFMRDYHVILVEDCCAAASPEEHRGTLVNMRKYFGAVHSAADLLRVLNDEPALPAVGGA